MPRLAAHLAAGVNQCTDYRLQIGGRSGAVDQYGFRRTAHAGAPHLGIAHDGLRHLKVRRLVDEHMANAFEVAEHRYAGVLLHAFDKAFSAPRHDEVNGAAKAFEHQADTVAIGRRHHLDCGARQACRIQPALQAGDDGGG